MHKGFKLMLEALGIHLDPEELETFFVKLKSDIPSAAQYVQDRFKSLDERLTAIERLLQSLTGGGVEPGQLLSGAELTLWETGEITQEEMRALLMRRLTTQRKKRGVRNGTTDYIRISD
jgi:hypothetical protein